MRRTGSMILPSRVPDRWVAFGLDAIGMPEKKNP